ncbi:MAG TPA: amidohydrolase family protein [Chloroflexota bacterium]|jgi:predicted TIM-barrel fold metal-dependent hydrolase|nr:amidohydrolase family protein [Chloroflexota bacterium]
MSRTSIVDADGHITENRAQLVSHLPDMYRESGNILHLGRLFPAIDHLHSSPIETPFNPRATRHEVGPEEWLEFLEDVGIESTVLYPSSGLAQGWVTDLDWSVATARAYNDWLHAEYVERDERFKGIALIPMQDPEAAVLELRRAIEQLGMVGAMIPSNGLPTEIGSKIYWPIYREADRLGCALAVHGGSHRGYGMDYFNRYAPAHGIGHPLGQLIGLASIVFNGIFDKFPNARIGFMEGGVAWFLMALERFDRSHETHQQLDPTGQFRGPSDGEKVSAYLQKHIDAGRLFIGCEGSEPLIGKAVELVGHKPFMFSSDFPHEVNNVFCKEEIEELEENVELSDADKAAILGGNARLFYQLAAVPAAV